MKGTRRAQGIAARRDQVAGLYLKGSTMQEIAHQVGVDRGTVSRDLKELRKLWTERAVAKIDRWRAEQLAKIDTLEREAWDAWERSQRERQTTTLEQNGVVMDPRKGDVIGAKVKKTLKTEKLTGDAQYLGVIQWCISARRELLGLDAPKDVNLSGSVSTVVKVLRGVSMDDL